MYPGDAHVYRSASAAYEAGERERARELLEKVREETEPQANLRWREAPSVGRGLHELCEVIGADLLVVGSSRRGLLGRVLMGDDTRAALNGAPCAIAIAPTGYSAQPLAMREIGVGYDGSPESEHAVTIARRIAAECGAKLSAFEAVSLPTYTFVGGVGSNRRRARRRWSTRRESDHRPRPFEPHAVYGRPVEELAVYSASLDLLVVGSRSYGPIGRLIHGSTSLELAGAARCPLLVLTRGAREATKENAAEGDRDSRTTQRRDAAVYRR